MTSASKATKDTRTFEWAMYYIETPKRLILQLGKITDEGITEASHVFSYGRV